MSREKFDAECKGCRPAMLNIKTGSAYPEDHPIQRMAIHVFDTMSLADRAAFHRATCLNSRDRQDLFVMQKMSERIGFELTKAYPNGVPE